MPKLTLEPHGKRYKLAQTDEAGEKTEMLLTADSLAVLAQSAPRILRTILATQSSGDIQAGTHMPVAQVSLNTDVHRCEILLGMIDSQGAEERFALPFEVAKALAEKLPVRVSEIEATIPNRTQQ